MHEMSIALCVLDFVEEEAARRSNAVVKAVHIKLGALSGVVKQALASAYDLAREGTNLANCELVIDELPIVVRCNVCGAECPAESIQNIRCSVCQSAEIDVVSGRELEVAALEIES
ncbi:MAG TPA: hydrogenase maturation nickel metallochaperone HypA [Pirellulales bacterium]|nr:hydrogenase maturation nickel metallochaperone HypA [Pirellulales bacterium]